MASLPTIEESMKPPPVQADESSASISSKASFSTVETALTAIVFGGFVLLVYTSYLLNGALERIGWLLERAANRLTTPHPPRVSSQTDGIYLLEMDANVPSGKAIQALKKAGFRPATQDEFSVYEPNPEFRRLFYSILQERYAGGQWNRPHPYGDRRFARILAFSL